MLKSMKELAQEKLDSLLSGAEKARTNSLKPSSIQYASELSDQLLGYAKDLETMYKDLTADLKKHDDPSKFKSWLAKIQEKEAFGEKAKAWFSVVKPFVPHPVL